MLDRVSFYRGQVYATLAALDGAGTGPTASLAGQANKGEFITHTAMIDGCIMYWVTGHGFAMNGFC